MNARGPFLGASLASGAAEFHLSRLGTGAGRMLAVVFALTALVSFGPQKYFDDAISRIWPTVVTAQGAIIVRKSSARSRSRFGCRRTLAFTAPLGSMRSHAASCPEPGMPAAL